MNSPSKKYKTVKEYLSLLPKSTRKILEGLRMTIKQTAPNAEEVISYNMPAFKGSSVLVHYAAYKNHIGFYPTAFPIKIFKEELTKYKTSKGAIQFPIDEPIPTSLVKKIVKYRMKEDDERANAKKQLTKSKTRSVKTK